jgi:hypothetical protein
MERRKEGRKEERKERREGRNQQRKTVSEVYIPYLGKDLSL